MAGLGKAVAGQQEPQGGLGGALQGIWDEATGAFARYGRRSGAQRDASLAMLNQSVDPNTDPLTGAGMKALGLAGLVTHPLAFFPTGDEWRERLANAGNTSRLGQSIGGMLGDLPSVVDPHLLAGGGALAMAPLASKLMNKADDVADAGITAYHGSPHKFDKFDMSKIGMGEGHQAYGRGLYFGEARETGEAYKKDLSRGTHIDKDGIATPLSKSIEHASVQRVLREDVGKALTFAKQLLWEKSQPKDMLKRDIERLKAAKDRGLTPNPGHLYEVKIAGTVDEFPEYIGPQGAEAKAFADQARASGAKGIRYLDQVSRDKGAGTYNYVVFDDKLITILKKYGIPMTAGAGGAMMVAGQDMPTEFAAQMGGT
jgi:hypothetical protein